MIGRMLPATLHPRIATNVMPVSRPVSAVPSQLRVPPTAYDLAGHLVAAEAAALVGANETSRARVNAYAHDVARAMRLPDATRPIDHKSARTAVHPLTGVRSAIWLDRANLAVMVNGQR